MSLTVSSKLPHNDHILELCIFFTVVGMFVLKFLSCKVTFAFYQTNCPVNFISHFAPIAGLTVDERSLHVAGSFVDIISILVVKAIVEQKSSVGQALDDRVHKTSVTNVT